tara:strand:+ start:444 stop:668 length:225 start_codon:yes stop_codon:yes gene_type:complete
MIALLLFIIVILIVGIDNVLGIAFYLIFGVALIAIVAFVVSLIYTIFVSLGFSSGWAALASLLAIAIISVYLIE